MEIINNSENAIDTSSLQVRRVVRLYALTFDVARLVAELAYDAGLPR